jgi:DNA-binding NarL/FixJ family response regulator
MERELQRADEGASAKAFVALIAGHRLLREWLRRPMQSAFSLPVITYSSVSKLEGQLRQAPPDFVIFSLMQSHEASINALKVLLELVPTVPVIVLCSFDDVDLARTVLRLGAKGYIRVTNGFDLASQAVREAVRFVLDGRARARGARLRPLSPPRAPSPPALL